MEHNYIDISNIVKVLDEFYYSTHTKNKEFSEDNLKCKQCGKISHKDNFEKRRFTKLNKKTSNYEEIIHYNNLCIECFNYNRAEEGLQQILYSFLNVQSAYEIIDDDNEFEKKLKEREEKIKVINTVITPEIVKLRVILNKLTNKIRNYDASKQ